MKAAPGWYQDPGGAPGQLRYYDGQQWTEHRAAPAVFPTPMPYPPHPGAPMVGEKTTPDGRPLASWGLRLAAQLIDNMILGVLNLVVTLPVLLPIIENQANSDQQWADTHPGQIRPIDPFWIYRDHWHALILLGAFGIITSAIYYMGSWRWKQASPGKLAIGLRIEYRDSSDPLTWGAIVKRWLVLGGVGIFSIVGSLFRLVDCLWPLWDKQSQALHEKWPKTNVIRTK